MPLWEWRGLINRALTGKREGEPLVFHPGYLATLTKDQCTATDLGRLALRTSELCTSLASLASVIGVCSNELFISEPPAVALTVDIPDDGPY